MVTFSTDFYKILYILFTVYYKKKFILKKNYNEFFFLH
jgi:hypothetical protein